LELYKEEDITQEELIKYSNQVGDTLSNLKVMLDNLLNWARSSMDKGLLPRKVTVDIAFISAEIKRQLTAQLEGKGLEVLFSNNEESKEVWVETDPAFFTVIIRNLLSNAIKFTQPYTSIGFDIFLDEKANKVEISISDKGAGLSEQVIQEILQSNTGVMSKPGTKGELGSGIGLMLCKEFTKALGGQLSAKSVINQGSTFIVTLPIR
jgi:signal transduction histidine kinase